MSNIWQTNSFYGKPQVIKAKCSLISEDRFQVDLSSYSEEAIGFFKTVPSRSYG